MSNQSKGQAVTAAMSVANDVTEGRLAPAELERQALEECRELFGKVAGPGDPLWELHVDIARQVLAHDGVPFNEMTEWVAVHRQRAGVDVPTAEVETPQPPVSSAPDEPEYAPEPVQADPPGSQAEVNPYGPARRIVARGRGLPGGQPSAADVGRMFE